MSYPTECPQCKADFDAGPIPAGKRHLYAGDRFLRVISVQNVARDRHDRWRCPDCEHEWR